jgi:hypothetical protein
MADLDSFAFQFKRQQRDQMPSWMIDHPFSLVGAMTILGYESEGPLQLGIHVRQGMPGIPCKEGDWVINTSKGLTVVTAEAFEMIRNLDIYCRPVPEVHRG